MKDQALAHILMQKKSSISCLCNTHYTKNRGVETSRRSNAETTLYNLF